MPAPTDRTQITDARLALKTAREDLVDKLYDYETALAAYREASRRGPVSGVGLAATKGAFEGTRAAVAEQRAQLHARLGDWLPENTTPDEDVARLPANRAITLMPVRLETRFDGDKLLVRVIPDEIFLNTHETALTPEERDAGQRYWEGWNTLGNERDQWRDLVARFGVERAAYIVKAMTPNFGESELEFGATSSPVPNPCGSQFPGGDNSDISFDAVKLRSSSWTRPGEVLLPDRWVFITYRNGTPTYHVGKPIPEPLAMTTDPKALPTDFVQLFGNYNIDDQILWTANFQRAVDVGMAIEIALSAEEAQQGFDRLIVVGVKTSMLAFLAGANSPDSGEAFAALVEAHHYTRGIGILPQGTPTNNTENRPTSYPLTENAGETSFEFERASTFASTFNNMTPGTTGERLGAMLGVPSCFFANVQHARTVEITQAQLMNEVLWPGTLGYFMHHMMNPMDEDAARIFTPEQIAKTKDYFKNYVIPRGPAPAFRVGGIPYGVLPVTALSLWEPRTASGSTFAADRDVEEGLRIPLLHLLEVWKESASRVPRIRATDEDFDPDIDVATVLSTYPSAREFRVRTGIGFDITLGFWELFNWDAVELVRDLDQQSEDTFGLIDHSSWHPRLGRTLFLPFAPLYTGEVVANPVSETATLASDFIAGIRDASFQDLTDDNVPSKPATPNLFYQILRHSTLTEYVRRYHEQTDPRIWYDFEIFGLSIDIPDGLQPIYDQDPNALKALIPSHLDALNALGSLSLSTAELERLFTETLDTVSHRLDPWLTALAYRRVNEMFVANGSARGNYLGGYGWLEEVRPRPRTTVPLAGVGDVETQLTTGGLIHAPSMTHASAAAVLRNAHLSVRDDDPQAYTIDLSSMRVRRARRLFEAVRNGQPLGAVLGYEFERGLHEGHPNVMGLDPVRFALRTRFPLVANKSGTDSTEPAESIAARNVVDGVSLLRAKDAGEIVFGQGGLPALDVFQQPAVDQEFERLRELYDATADLLTAEGVFQFVRGNIDAAMPTMNNLAVGAQPPDTVVSQSARGGIGISHRVALVFPGDPPSLSAEWENIPLTPRSIAERALNVWLSQLVGDPNSVIAKLTYRDAAGAVITSTHDEGGVPVVKQNVTIALTELRIHPLDLLILAEPIAQNNQGSILDRRIVAVGLENPNKRPDAPAARFDVTYDLAEIEIEPSIENPRAFSEIMEILHAAAGVLGTSRPLAVDDLLSPAEVDEGVAQADTARDADAEAFYARAALAAEQFENVRLGLETANATTYRTVLTEAAAFEPLSAFPDPAVPDDELAAAVGATFREFERRKASVSQLLPPRVMDPPPEPFVPRSVLIREATKILKALFGQNFLALPTFAPPGADELKMSLDARGALLPEPDDDEAPDRYLQQIMRSRPRLGSYRKLNLYARTVGLARPRVDVVQLPHIPGERWLGLPFQTPPEEGRVALLLLNYTSALSAVVSWTGIHIDNWLEIVPNPKEETGIAFHYDSPRTQAPQTVLVVAPAKANAAAWSFDEIRVALEQTMDLMKARAVDSEFLSSTHVAQALPGAMFANNEGARNVVTTNIAPIGLGVDTEGLE